MNLTITFTRLRRLPKPCPLPRVSPDEARRLTEEFWHGIALGLVLGGGLLMIVLASLGRLK